jgi:hypothetical protein
MHNLTHPTRHSSRATRWQAMQLDAGTPDRVEQPPSREQAGQGHVRPAVLRSLRDLGGPLRCCAGPAVRRRLLALAPPLARLRALGGRVPRAPQLLLLLERQLLRVLGAQPHLRAPAAQAAPPPCRTPRQVDLQSGAP